MPASKRPIEMDLLLTKLTAEERTLRQQITGGLRVLKQRVEQAQKDIEGNVGRLDGHLLTNASHLSGDIARWNLIIELLPLVQTKS